MYMLCQKREALFLQDIACGPRFEESFFRKRNVCPSREPVLFVPFTFPVSEQYYPLYPRCLLLRVILIIIFSAHSDLVSVIKGASAEDYNPVARL